MTRPPRSSSPLLRSLLALALGSACAAGGASRRAGTGPASPGGAAAASAAPCAAAAEPARGGAAAPAPSHGDYLGAVLAEFPEAYRELARVTYEHVSVDAGSFAIDEVRVLAPAARISGLPQGELKARACRAKRRLGLECACEDVVLAPAEDAAWHSWPDKRVVPVTVRFLLGC